jgi:Ring finger domain/PA domain
LILARQQLQQAAEAEWEEIPAELLAPQNATHRGRPTSKRALARIPRVILHDKSSLFRQASLSYANQQCSAIPAEFGPSEAFQIKEAAIVIGSPRTAKGGLSEECKIQIKEARDSFVYLERGDDVTFVYKALQAQQAGARAVIIGNNQSSPWPYVMKDSVGEAQKMGLKVPVVMIQQHEGKNLVDYCKQRNSLGDAVSGELNILSLSKECAVCCDTYNVNDTIMTLPACSHVFHEKCALAWLTKHNTCPFCRRELPTDDTDYEQERRRMQRTHAGSAPNGNQSQWSEFYG